MSRLLAFVLSALLASCALAPEPRTAPAPVAHAQIAVTAHPLATRAALAMLDKGGCAHRCGHRGADGAGAGRAAILRPRRRHPGHELGRGLAKARFLRRARRRARARHREPAHRHRREAPGERGVAPGRAHGGRSRHARRPRDGARAPWQARLAGTLRARHRARPKRASRCRATCTGSCRSPGPPPIFRTCGSLYFAADGKPLPVGAAIRNPAYAKTLRRIAIGGPAAFLEGGGAKAIVESAQRGFRPTLMTEKDLLDYRAAERDPVCAPFLAYRVCTMAPPSFGGSDRPAGAADGRGARGRALRLRRRRLRAPLRGGRKARAGGPPAVRGRPRFREGADRGARRPGLRAPTIALDRPVAGRQGREGGRAGGRAGRAARPTKAIPWPPPARSPSPTGPAARSPSPPRSTSTSARASWRTASCSTTP